MNNDQLFQIANAMVLPGWLLLAIVPRWKWTGRIVVGVIVTVLALMYATLVFQALRPEDFQNFSTLDGLASMFSNKQAVLVGWIHYLAFDLLAGWYIVADAARHQVKRWLLLPCLLFTFMMGPVGLLLYFILRIAKTRRYFHDDRATGHPRNPAPGV